VMNAAHVAYYLSPLALACSPGDDVATRCRSLTSADPSEVVAGDVGALLS